MMMTMMMISALTMKDLHYYVIWSSVLLYVDHYHRNVTGLWQTFTFTTLWTNLADDKLMIFFLIFPRKLVLTFHANCLQKYFNMSSVKKFTQSAKL